MQLSEMIIWKGIDTNNKKLNSIGTKFGKYLLPTHNIAIGLGILFLYYSMNPYINYLPLLIGVLFFVNVLMIYKSNPHSNLTFPANKKCRDKSCQNNENRLKWPYPHSWYIYSFMISLIFLIIYIEPLGSKIFLGIFFLITFFISLFKFPQSMGSVWCFSTAILAPFVVIVNYFLVKH
jgi:hypothetical protein